MPLLCGYPSSTTFAADDEHLALVEKEAPGVGFYRLHGMRPDDQGRLYALSEIDSLLIRLDQPATAEYPSQIVPVSGTRSHYFVLTRDG